MAERDFTITLFEDKLAEFKLDIAKSVIKPAARDIFFFAFDTEPNVEADDIISVRILIDEESTVTFKAIIDTKVPPLAHPATTESFLIHEPILKRYFADTVVDQIRTDYFNGKGYKDSWTIFFKRVEE